MLAMPWVKGQSGNPAGRAVEKRGNAEWLRTYARTRYGEKAIERLARALESSDDKIAIQAAAELLDRAGVVAPKPVELVTTTTPATPKVSTVEDLEAAATEGTA